MTRAVILALAAFVGVSPSAEAAPTWFFKGRCEDSRVKRGSLSEDLTIQAGERINCDIAILTKFKNGRVLMQFHTGTGVLGFAGPFLNETTDDTTYLPIDKIYPVRDLGLSADEILKNSASGEGVIVDGVDGICTLNGSNFKHVRKIKCIAKHEIAQHKSVYSVTIDVSRVTRHELPGL